MRWPGMQAEEAPAAPADEEIFERILAGETPLHEVLMRRHNRRLYRIARTGSSLAAILPIHESRCDRIVASVFRRIHAGDLTPSGALPF